MAMCSSFHGRIDEIPGISVDNFENPNIVRARAYFLSHCHTDHTRGLHKKELLNTLEETGAFIYMSANTAAVINDEKCDDQLMEYVKVLKLGTNSITLPSQPEKDLEDLHLDVILVPAAHSFGSVMFLFKLPNKTVLFTGDFRISPNDIQKYNHFHCNGDPIQIDTMYVDTTFMNCSYNDFPKRSASIEDAIEEIRNWIGKSGENRVALHTSAKYGYEYVFNQIFVNLNMKVYVGEDRWRFFSNLPDLIPGVTNEENTKIHLCRNSSENRSHVSCVKSSNSKSDAGNANFLFVHFSAMKWRNMCYEETVRRISANRIDVCFPTHCSRKELRFFVNYFKPKKVVGFPNEYDSTNGTRVKECNITYEVSPKKRRVSPKIEKYVDKKVDKKLLTKMFEL